MIGIKSFLQNLHGNQTPQAAFSAQSSRSHPHAKSYRGRFRGFSTMQKRKSYASACSYLAGYAQRVSSTSLDAHLVQAFQAQCNISIPPHPTGPLTPEQPLICYALQDLFVGMARFVKKEVVLGG